MKSGMTTIRPVFLLVQFGVGVGRHRGFVFFSAFQFTMYSQSHADSTVLLHMK